MNFEVLTLIVLFVSSFECAVLRLDKFCAEIICGIAQYLELPHSQLGLVNKELNGVFREELSYKRFLSYRFALFELLDVPDGLETELLAIGALVKFYNPIHVFKSIRHDLIKLKRFPNAGRPLAKYLYRFFRKNDEESRLQLDPWGTFYDDLTNFFIENGHFDLLIEFQMEEPMKMFKGLMNFGNTRSFLDNAAENEIVRSFYVSSLKTATAELLTSALLYNLKPQSTELFEITVNIIRERINHDQDLSSSERLLEFFSSFELFQSIRNVEISPEFFNNFIMPKITNRAQVFDLMMLASIIGKRDLINELVKDQEFAVALTPFLQDLRDATTVLKPEDVKVFFEYYAGFKDDLIFNSEFLTVLMKFYTFRSIETVQNGSINGELLIVFKAPRHLVSLGFPEELEYRYQGQMAHFYSIIWDEMVVDDLDTFKEFFQSYLRLKPASTLAIFVDAKVLKMFLRDGELVNWVLAAGIKLVLSNGNEYLLLSEDAVPDLNRIIVVTNKLTFLTSAKNREEFRRAEILCNSGASEIILGHYSYDELLELNEEDYFELRGALKYWATQTDPLNPISRIESPVLLQLLGKELA